MALGVRGTLKIRDGSSNLVLIAGQTGSSANCSADQVLESLTLLVWEPRSKATETVDIKIRGNIDDAAVYDVEITFQDESWPAEMEARSLGRPHDDAPRGRQR